jgi:hypothetical protein
MTTVGIERVRSLFLVYLLSVILPLHTACSIGPGVWYTTWLHMGLLAIIAFSLVILVSLRPVREKSYQLFFWTHFVSVL